MGTTWRAEVFADRSLLDSDLHSLVTAELDLVVRQMSHWRSDSDLSRFNAAPANRWVDLPPELFFVLSTALSLAAETGGAFDPTLGLLVNAWGFGPEGRLTSDIPTAEQIARHFGTPGRDHILLDAANLRALQPGGLKLDLSSIAKGYAVDRATCTLIAAGASSCLLEIGGELRGWGVKPSGEPWWVSIESPPERPDFPQTLVALCNSAIATSGNYRRFVEHGSRRYTHTVDPRTGYPVEHAADSVTVLHADCMFADAYSTALVVLGPEGGIAFADRIGLAANLVVGDGSTYRSHVSRAFSEMLD